jgi:hypothetical protein
MLKKSHSFAKNWQNLAKQLQILPNNFLRGAKIAKN